jgi:acetylornithine deacetylase/succinyl-diaminopimelate desuccinylase-like protein
LSTHTIPGRTVLSRAVLPCAAMSAVSRSATLAAAIVAAACLASPARADAPPDYKAAARRVRALLGDLVAADTTNPPGNEARAARLGAEALRRAGIASEVTEFGPGRHNLVARLRGDGSARPLLLLAHTDVVTAAGQRWSTRPHQMIEKDGFLIGRGVSDDLGRSAAT